MKKLKEIIMEESGGIAFDYFSKYIEHRIADISLIDEKQDQELENIGCSFRKDKFVYEIDLTPFTKEGYALKDLFFGTVFENICVDVFNLNARDKFDLLLPLTRIDLDLQTASEINNMSFVYYYNGWEFSLFPALCKFIAIYNPKGFLNISTSKDESKQLYLEIKDENFINIVIKVEGIKEIEKILLNTVHYTGFPIGRFVILNLGENFLCDGNAVNYYAGSNKTITWNKEFTIQKEFSIIKSKPIDIEKSF